MTNYELVRNKVIEAVSRRTWSKCYANDIIYPSVFTIKNGKHIPARPMRYRSLINDFKLALLVFFGKADAFIWPEDESIS